MGNLGAAMGRDISEGGSSLLNGHNYKKTRNIAANSDQCPKSMQNNLNVASDVLGSERDT